ncbi:MAG: hypothetical protein ACK56I_09570, partial [bacterium]
FNKNYLAYEQNLISQTAKKPIKMDNDNILSPNILKKGITVENSKVQVIPKGLVNISIPIKVQENNN